jgi:hypothetical protein
MAPGTPLRQQAGSYKERLHPMHRSSGTTHKDGAGSGTTKTITVRDTDMSEHVQPLEITRSTDAGRDTRKVIFASSLGTVFEWYDFFLYGALAAVISKQFFAGFVDRQRSMSID